MNFEGTPDMIGKFVDVEIMKCSPTLCAESGTY
ncbi:hypothetical protein ACNKHS_03745 [Shigella flexneri]